MSRLITLFRRSLTAHLALIFAATGLAGFLIYAESTKPDWSEYVDPRSIEAVDATLALHSLATAGASQDAMLQDPAIQPLAAINPNFGFIVWKQDQSWTFNETAAPASIVSVMQQLKSVAAAMPNECVVNDVYGQSDRAERYNLNVRFCEKERIALLVFGISAIPEPVITRFSWIDGENWLRWNGFYHYGLGAIAALLYMAAALLWVRRTLGRAEDAANDLLVDARQSLIPEDKVPLEFLPLVRSVNAVGVRAANSLQSQQFFLSAAAHELRTPLTVMRLRLDDLPDGDTKQEFLTDLRRLSNVMNGLLEFMRVSAIDARYADVDLSSACREALQQVAASAERAKVTIAFEEDPAQGRIGMQGIEKLVVLALTNLMHNAISFSSPDDTVELRLTEGPQISIRDHGPGFALSVVSSVGRPFQKHPNNRPGSGLGLSIVERVMSLHGGTISIRNCTAGGSIVTLCFKNN